MSVGASRDLGRRGISASLSEAAVTVLTMANFVTGTHECPDCGQPQTGSRAFEERRADGTKVDWCAFLCAKGHAWARPGMQAVK